MDRRTFLSALTGSLLAAPLAKEAQQAGKVPRLGALIHGHAPTPEQTGQSPLGRGLSERGWVRGQNLVIEVVYSEGQAPRLAELAAELVRRQVDIIWCNGPPSAVAAARATKTIPIVFWGVAFPVELGLVASLARPGGNVAGFAYTAGTEILAKLVDLLRTVAPNTTRIAAVFGASAAQKVSGEPFLPSAFYESAFRGQELASREQGVLWQVIDVVIPGLEALAQRYDKAVTHLAGRSPEV